MMRRGPLADTSIRTLLEEAATERITGVIELHSVAEGLVYLVDGEVYLADIAERATLQDRFVDAGLITREQLERHAEPGEDEVYLGLALDTDETIDEAAIARWLLDLTVTTLEMFEGASEGEYELDPYGQHPSGILASWQVSDVFARLDEIEAEHAEQQRLAEAERAEAEARAEAERAEAEARAAAERAEAEAERAEEEARAEIERLEAERVVEAEGSDAPGSDADRGDGGSPDGPPVDSDDGSSELPDRQSARDNGVDLDSLPPPPQPAEPTGPGPTPKGPAARVLVVTPDTAPEDLDVIELEPLEWRIVVIAAQGTSLVALADRLNLDEAETGELVDGLCGRGLLAKVG